MPRLLCVGLLIGCLMLSPLANNRAVACPFCAAVSSTFCEEVGQADVAVLAKLVELSPPSDNPIQNPTATIKPAKFKIVEVLKGADLLGKEQQFEVIYFGNESVGKDFLVMAINSPEEKKLAWATPIAITPAVIPYLKMALTLPKAGADRLAFFQDYLESSDEMLKRDAYDEFAKAPYASVIALKDRMQHDNLIAWIKDPKVTASHRRLYLTMLGVCGTEKDAVLLEEMLRYDGPEPKLGLDALIAAYLTLKGESGLPLIEEKFLADPDAEYTETYAAIMSIRFHGEEEKIIPKQRLVKSLQLMLARPQLADLVIPDLARWEAWDSLDRLVELFKESDDDSGWVRVPVINFLRACPKPEAKTHLDELAKLDPESFKRAQSFFPLGGGVAPQPVTDGKTNEKLKDSTGDEPSASDEKLDEIPDASKVGEDKQSSTAVNSNDEVATVSQSTPLAVRGTGPLASSATQATALHPVEAAAALAVDPADKAMSGMVVGKTLFGLALGVVALFAAMLFVVGGKS